MAKVTIEFDLDSPEDRCDHQRAVRAGNMADVLYDFDQWLRSEIKYQEKDYDEIRDKLHSFLDENHVYLDEIIN